MAFRLISTRTVLAAASVATAGLVAACGAGVNNASSTAPLSSSASPTSTATSTATSAPAPSTTKPPHSMTAVAPVPATTTATPPGAGTGSGSGGPATGECQTSGLRVSLGGSDGAAGHNIVSLVFTNVSAKPCTMISFPGVSYVDSSGKQIGAAAVREGSRGTGVTLQPGQRASAQVSETRVDLYDPGACKKTTAVGLRVYPPHNTQPVTVPQSGAAGCAGSIPGNQLTVQSVQKD